MELLSEVVDVELPDEVVDAELPGDVVDVELPGVVVDVELLDDVVDAGLLEADCGEDTCPSDPDPTFESVDTGTLLDEYDDEVEDKFD